MNELTPEQKKRKREFKKIYANLPFETAIEKKRFLMKVARVEFQTVRVWLMKDTHRIISQRSLDLIKQAVEN